VSTIQFPDPEDQAIVYPPESAAAAQQPLPPISESASAFLQLVLAFLTWLGSCLLLAIVPVVAVVPYIVYQISVQPEFRAESLATDKTVILLTLLGVIPAHVITIFLAWAVVTRWRRRPFWETISWSWPDAVDPWTRALRIGAIVLLAVALLALGWLITWKLGGGETQIDQLIKSSFAARITTAFLAAATAPFVEEVIYRGVLYPAVDRAFGALWGVLAASLGMSMKLRSLDRAFGTVWAVLVVSVMFAGVHVIQYSNNLGVIAVISMLSITLTLVRAYTGRLFPCFLIHLVFNGIQSITIVASPYLERFQHPEKTAGAIIGVIELLIRQFG
jgi:membrane protease YdiL (CAAX protease family)